MTDTGERLDDLALTEAAFVTLKGEIFWDQVKLDRVTAEVQLQDALYAFCTPDCGDCPLKAMGLLCGCIDSAMSRAEQAIQDYHASIYEPDADERALSDYWHGWFVDECQRMIDAIRQIRKGAEQ